MLTVYLLIKSLIIIKQSSIVKMFPIHLNNQYHLLCVLQIIFENIFFQSIKSLQNKIFLKKKQAFLIGAYIKIKFRMNIL